MAGLEFLDVTSKRGGVKYCFVPLCPNNTKTSSNKRYLSVPLDIKTRKKWVIAARRDEKSTPIKATSKIYCCEDHFNLSEDVQNYQYVKMMGGLARVKNGVVPHIFDCQSGSTFPHLAKPKKAICTLEEASSSSASPIQNEDDSMLQNCVASDCKVKSGKGSTFSFHRNKSPELPFKKKNNYKYKCDVCHEHFQRPSPFKKHILSHEEKLYQCDTCGEQFKWKANLEMHMIIHVSRDQVSSRPNPEEEDPLMHSVITKEEELHVPETQEIQVSDSILPFESIVIKQEPDEEMESENCEGKDYLNYIDEHIGVKKEIPHDTLEEEPDHHEAVLAEEANEIPSYMIVNLNTTKAPSKDNMTGSPLILNPLSHFEKAENLIQEIEKSNMEYESKIQRIKLSGNSHTEGEFVCEVCEKVFQDHVQLNYHVQCMHPVKNKCDICGTQYTKKSDLEKHKHVSHPPEKKFMCHICGRAFHHESLLQSHLLTHSGVKPYKCDVCGKEFRQNTLNIHKQIHEKKRRFKCEFCKAAFRQPHLLKRHLRLHTDRPRFECHVCHKSFSDKYYLKTHIILHTNQKQYMCIHCGKDFIQKGNLTAHLHPNILTRRAFKLGAYLCN